MSSLQRCSLSLLYMLCIYGYTNSLPLVRCTGWPVCVSVCALTCQIVILSKMRVLCLARQSKHVSSRWQALLCVEVLSDLRSQLPLVYAFCVTPFLLRFPFYFVCILYCMPYSFQFTTHLEPGKLTYAS